jgi:cytochrome c oxidase subunit 4
MSNPISNAGHDPYAMPTHGPGQTDGHGHTGGPGDAQDGGHHATSLWLYVYVFVALCLLTSASFFTYSSAWPYHTPETEWVGWTFMMAVSCTKALLVILFFMHVKYEKSWKYVLTIPTGMMAIFLVLMLVPDIGRRTYYYSEERLQNAADPHRQTEATVHETAAAPQHGTGNVAGH